MNININSKSGVPIYEQIEEQIKKMILSGALKEGESLPSIRGFASDLKISVITIKKAYENLEKENLVYSVPGKGFYVDNPNTEYMREKETRSLESDLSEWIQNAKEIGIGKSEAIDMLEILW
ncbi:GntR family transcriptional regulator [Eubacterium xylanophilum]|uniref:GntR family transcriptional regulator n=1 Tax=Eubacterium xylanophilum TaxID=39497 RepID=UPI00047C230F|nr:GntR family transcriptional regulator [Eubacterium xylanophilum]